jgi:hypothetical protein
MVAPVKARTSTPVEVSFGSPGRQRRVTVFFRVVLVIPQAVVLLALGIAAFVVLVVGWFGALVTGTLPDFAGEFLTGYLRWSTRVLAYEYLLTDRYPPFSFEPSPAFPVDLAVRTGRMNRWAILFRYFLAIPGSLAAGLVSMGMYVFGVVTWVATLVKGETPRTIFEANAAAIRYLTRFNGYFYMLTSFYPAQVLGDGGPAAPDGAAPLTEPVPPPPALIDPGFAANPPERPGILPPLEGFSPAVPPPPAAGQQPPGPPASPSTFAPPFGSATDWTARAASVPPSHGEPIYGGQSVPRQPLVLSPGARRLVVAFFCLGFVGYVAYFAVAIPTFLGVSAASHQSVAAQNQAVDAYNVIGRRVRSFTAAGTACSHSAGTAGAQVACLEANDAQLASAFEAYAHALSTIDFPSSVATRASAAESAATAAGAAMSQIAAAGADPQAYQTAVADSNIQAVFDQVDTTFNALNSALIDGTAR